MKRVLFLALLLFIVIQTTYAQSFNANLSAKLQSKLDSLVTLFSYNTKGISASVYCPGQGIWTGVSGISYEGYPLTSDMKFGIASNSKLFTAVTILKLAEDKILSLNDPLSKWIPAYPNINPSITIRQLLNHTSGVSDPFFTESLLDTIRKYPTRVYTPEEILALVKAPVSLPGAGYSYSNINYILAGMVAKSASGEEISTLIRNYILTPLQLNGTFYDIAEAEITPLAHRWTGEVAVDLHDTSRISLNTAGGPAGSIFSTATDMASWYNALMSHQVLSESSFAELTNFLSPGNYGLGLQLSNFFSHPVWGHGGSTIGYKSRLIYDPCMKTTVCGLSNSDWSAVDGITMLLFKVLLDYLPACAGSISGTTNVIQGQSSVTYSVPAITNAISYNWSLPTGFSGTSSSNSITVDIENYALSGDVRVKGINSYGEGAESALSIHVNKVLTGNLLVTNSMITNGTNDCFNATQTITLAGGGTTVSFESGSIVDLIAGQSIHFLPGFHAQNGSWMDARITNDGSFCDGVTESQEVLPMDKSLQDNSVIFLNNEDVDDKVKVYPNPNNGSFFLEYSNLEIGTEILICNMMGKQVHQYFITDIHHQRIELSDLTKGIYIINIANKKQQIRKKMVVH